MSKNIGIGTVIAVALIVAVIVSAATATITSNVIKVTKQNLGTEVYTKAEMDNNITTRTLYTTDIQDPFKYGYGPLRISEGNISIELNKWGPIYLNGFVYLSYESSLSVNSLRDKVTY